MTLPAKRTKTTNVDPISLPCQCPITYPRCKFVLPQHTQTYTCSVCLPVEMWTRTRGYQGEPLHLHQNPRLVPVLNPKPQAVAQPAPGVNLWPPNVEGFCLRSATNGWKHPSSCASVSPSDIGLMSSKCPLLAQRSPLTTHQQVPTTHTPFSPPTTYAQVSCRSIRWKTLCSDRMRE